MKKYRVKSVERYANHLVLTLTPKSDLHRLKFWPGQYAAIGFKRDGKHSPMRCFSMVSSPNSHELQFSMRPHGKFTGKVAELRPGDEMRVQGPFGNFVIDSQYDSNVIMLAAGIGITPFMSMLRHAAEAKLDLPIMLVYACRNVDDIPFYDEIRRLQTINSRIRAVFVVSQGPSDPARGIYQGRVDEALLRKITNQRFQGYTYFVCGPKSFLQAQQNSLQKNGVDENRIVSESFTQTTKLGWGFSGLSIPSLTYAATGLTFVIGFLGIMAMDLIRYAPKTTAASTAIGNTSSAAAADPSSSTSSQNTSAPTDATTPTNTNTPAATSPTSNQPMSSNQIYYQPPVSSVS